jgi:hypothetical protein
MLTTSSAQPLSLWRCSIFFSSIFFLHVAAALTAVVSNRHAAYGLHTHTHTHMYICICIHAYTEIRGHATQHTSAYVSRRQHTSACVSIRQHTSAHVSARQHTSGYIYLNKGPCHSAHVSIRQQTSADVSICQHAYVSMHTYTQIRGHATQHTSAYVSTRQHTSAYVSIRQHTYT